MKRWMLVTAMLAIGLAAPAEVFAQKPSPDDQPDMPLTPALRLEVIDGALKALNQNYVFPEVAQKMEQAVRDRLAKNEYDQITSAKEFVKLLTEHLRSVSKDKHLRVAYSYESLPKNMHREPTPADRARRQARAAFLNFGFERIERLDGNVGYLDVRAFMSPEVAGDTAAAAMNFLAHSDALILDLRQNGGGSPAAVALLCSYLFPAEPVVHLNDLYSRPENSTHQWWTLPHVPGKRFVDKPVYVLTSARTFSAAEECTYNLKNQKRATIVGEKTGGGAHPGGPQRINDHFGVWVPTGRAINPITGTNWEGTGVQPDIDVSADVALQTAHVDALKKIAEKKGEADEAREIKQLLETKQKELDDLKAKSQKAESRTKD